MDILSPSFAHYQRVLSITVRQTLCCFHLNQTSQWTVYAFNAETHKLNLRSLQRREPGVMKQVKAQKNRRVFLKVHLQLRGIASRGKSFKYENPAKNEIHTVRSPR